MHRRPKNPDTIQENGKVEGAFADHRIEEMLYVTQSAKGVLNMLCFEEKHSETLVQTACCHHCCTAYSTSSIASNSQAHQ